jgi:hypothetical protein
VLVFSIQSSSSETSQLRQPWPDQQEDIELIIIKYDDDDDDVIFSTAAAKTGPAIWFFYDYHVREELNISW